jgi:hydroxymethylglutaryl-CoA reductase (NADPH)
MTEFAGMKSERVPRDRENDYTAEMAERRRAFAAEKSGTSLAHVGAYTLDPATLPGNIENFLGAAQVPIGLAGPLLIDGEHAKGVFYTPMATTEGTLVASYNRGMRLLAAAGGAKTTVLERYMQRAPVFHFEDARAARDFGAWLDANLEGVRKAAEATTSIGRLNHIQQFSVGPKRFLRFNYATGDAAGQNMSGKATQAACEWIVAQYPGGARYTLSGAIDTDKKHSQMNTMHSRGARVVAEAVLPASALREIMNADAKALFRARQVSNAGGMLAGTANNGMHAANGLAALFIATGQVATYGGGTGLATQRECLEILDCYGAGKALKFAEICAATVLAGELSLASAIVAGDWVESHDRYGRNRP